MDCVRPHLTVSGRTGPCSTVMDSVRLHRTVADRTWSNRNSPSDPHSNKKVLMLISFKSPPLPSLSGHVKCQEVALHAWSTPI